MNDLQIQERNIDIQLIVVTNLANHIGSENGPEIEVLGTPCYDAMVVSVVIANAFFSATAISSGGALGPLAYAGYAGAMAGAAHNYCSCMNLNYGSGSC